MMKKCIVLFLLAFLFTGLYSQNRKCKGCKCNNTEVEAANEALLITDSQVDAFRALHIPFGVPLNNANQDDTLLVQEEFVVCYDREIRLPLWTSYLLTSDWADDDRTRRDCFRDDPRLNPDIRQVNCAYYDDSGYDRGHLSPRDDFNRSAISMYNTYLFSNIVPQFPNHNQSTWRWFEGYVNDLAEAIDSIYIYTGIIFDYNGDGLPDDKDDLHVLQKEKRPLAVASHFFKIITKKGQNGSMHVMAMLVPHDNLYRSKAESLEYIENACLVSVDTIEQLSGYDFFWELDDQIENAIESTREDTLWSLTD